jgi:S-adenosylmethionine decarboxylase
LSSYSPTGRHLLLDLWGVSPDVLDHLELLKNVARSMARVAQVHVRKEAWEKFEPSGVTGVLVLSESHISFHTYPEHGHLAVDIYTCGNHSRPEEAAKLLIQLLAPSRVQQSLVIRGLAGKKGKHDFQTYN